MFKVIKMQQRAAFFEYVKYIYLNWKSTYDGIKQETINIRKLYYNYLALSLPLFAFLLALRLFYCSKVR